MAQEAQAQIFTEPEPSEHDYQALLSLLSATARGRAFLAEYARRSRLAEAETLRNALTEMDERLGELMAPEAIERPPKALVHLVELLEPAPQEARDAPSRTAQARAPFVALSALSEEERLALFS